jgi:hypothetical protein
MGTAQVAFAVERYGGATGSHVTGSDVTGRGPDRNRVMEVCSAHAQPFPTFFSCHSSSTKCNKVVQVPWLPEVTRPRREFPCVFTCATGGSAISALVGPFDRK